MEDFKSTMISNYYTGLIGQNAILFQEFHQNTKHSKGYLMRNMYKSRTLLNSRNFIKSSINPEKHYIFQQSFNLKGPSKKCLFNLLNNRRSQVKIPTTNSRITFDIISNLFWSGYGKNKKNTRVIPSAGALYPLELYGIVFDDYEELPKGLYHYSSDNHSLSLISSNSELFNISNYIMMFQNMGKPSIIFFITTIFKRSTFKYDDRAYRYMLIEAGAMAQNISLMATEYNLVSTYMGGTDDFKVETLLGVDGKNESLINCLFITKDVEEL
ncbi:SagB/ThcOx family dehydrogenase [Staphylococcus lutrae]|uniref:Nitroreductase n=1 Tax=Staphylococcus lutrae TaxID=155085 RepID=A0AAC9RV69_9STAP|nr:SagB/ThcOx family dehydrogenase [Staphylococcus lutrae]ARJ51432.1 nitroreductase [Staphylococcus lutrae]PNZ34561.1 nitroreductase [Staphylococcus lutrae]